MTKAKIPSQPLVLVCGLRGQLAKSFAQVAPDNWLFLGRSELDFCDLEQLPEKLKKINPTLIVNTSAYTNVEQAENEKKNCPNHQCKSTQSPGELLP